MNVADPRFSAMFESHHYNIDPSAPEFRKTKGTDVLISEKLKRSEELTKKKRKGDKNEVPVENKKLKTEVKQTDTSESLASLVKSVKAKTKHFQSNKVKR